ncbi:MAG: polyprenyl synthetase family protein [Actinomycetota bacterium]|nr:polyprenyl synthetase family protein [Actinomycetota bacterium]
MTANRAAPLPPPLPANRAAPLPLPADRLAPLPADGAAPLPADLAFVTGRLRPYLADLLAAEQVSWKEHGAPWWDAPQALASFLGGGKALRPRFCYWGYAIGARRSGPMLLRACAALELLHAFALIHDDLMDGSATRRGVPVLHRQLAAEHRQQRWAGDPDAYGHAVALLTGDLAFALASRLTAMLPARARAVWADIVQELTIGQFLDLAGTARQDHSAEIARTTALLKSGRYTVTGPLRLGAVLAGQDDLPASLVRYGDLVGEAFQLRDDLLGVFGDPARTGKPVGEDLRAGKPTLLLAWAGAMLPPGQQPLLARAGSPALTDEDVVDLTGALDACGVRERVERRIGSNVTTARALLRDTPLAGPAREALGGLAAAAAHRRT